MLTCRDVDGNVLLAEDAVKGDTHICPECDEPLVLKQGSIVIHHFAHQPNSACTYSTGESIRHMEMKLQIGRHFQRLSATPCVQYEVRFGKEHRADVVVDDRFVVECQASAISVDELTSRTRDYNELGYPVLWVFDEGRLSGWDIWKQGRIEIRIPAEIRLVHQLAFGHLYILDAEGTPWAAHLGQAPWRQSPSGGWSKPKTLRRVALHKVGHVAIAFGSSDLGLRLVKMSEGVWWKLKRPEVWTPAPAGQSWWRGRHI